jgi:two-component system, NtrC family, sensor kinase
MNDSEKTSPAPENRILVVDDDKNAANYIAELLERAGYTVNTCAGGNEALGFIRKQAVDLVVLDVRMPGMDGFEVARRMKSAFGKSEFVPIVFLTAMSGQEDKITGLSLADEFITKPFDANELLARIKVLLRIRILQRELLVSKNRYEQEQKAARAQLYRSARLASIGTFASGVAHELNNPLTAILGFSSAVLERIKKNESMDKEELDQYVSIINAEAIRCRDTVENLSRFARESEVQTRNFPLRECVDGALQLVKSAAAKKHIALTATVQPQVLVRADLQKLQQAVVYILTNSLDFCPAGSAVAISSENDGRFVRLNLADNGPGIPADVLPNVFDPFFTTKEVGQGTGLGLAMCHVIMEECSGAIDITSEKGKGTTVTLDIPAVSPAPEGR